MSTGLFPVDNGGFTIVPFAKLDGNFRVINYGGSKYCRIMYDREFFFEIIIIQNFS